MTQPPPGGYPPPDPQHRGGGRPPGPGGQGPAGPPPGGPPPGGQPGYGPPPGGQPGYGPPPGGQPGYGPPPGGQPGYGPPPGGQPGYGPPPGAGPVDLSKVGVSAWVVIGSGLVLFIFSFFGWLSVSASGLGGYSYASAGAWHEYWWIATLLGVATAVIVALRSVMGQQTQQVKPLIPVILAAVGFVVTLVALIEIFVRFGGSDEYMGVSVGPGIGIWVCLGVSLIQTYFAWLWAQKQPGANLPKLPGPS